MYKIYLDENIITDEPNGWTSFKKRISRNIDERWLIISYPNDLIFYGDGFRYIYDKFNNNGYDVIIAFRAVKMTTTGEQISQTTGSIIMTDVQFDLIAKTATVQIKDDSYLSRIWNNRNNPIAIPARETKNGEEITNINPERSLNLSLVANGPQLVGDARIGWDVYDTFKQLVANMTDNEVNFESEILENLGTSDLYPRKLALISGSQLRKGNTSEAGETLVKISFQQLFRSVSRLLNLYLYPDAVNIPPVIKIGTEFDWYNSTTSIDFDQPDKLTQSFFQELFYSAVRLGGQTNFSKSDPTLNYPRVNFASWKNEQYYFSGVNNIDNELQLTVPDVIVDSNTINDVLVNGSDAYDDQIFMIEYQDVSGSYFAQGYQIANETVFNRRLMNDSMLERYNLANRVTENLTAFDNDYRVDYFNGPDDDKHSGVCEVFIPRNTTITVWDLGSTCSTNTQILNATDRSYINVPSTEGDARWNGSKWTAPVTGIYCFELTYSAGVQFPITGASQWGINADLIGIRKNGANIVETKPVANIKINESAVDSGGTYYWQNSNDSYILSRTEQVYFDLNINETVEFESRIYPKVVADVGGRPLPTIYAANENPPNPELTWTTGTFEFRVISTPQINIDFAQPDINPAQYKGSRINIETALNDQEIQMLFKNPNYSVQINNFVDRDELKKAWIQNAEIDETTGTVGFELITNLVEFDESTLSVRRTGAGIDVAVCEAEILCFANALNSQYLAVI